MMSGMRIKLGGAQLRDPQTKSRVGAVDKRLLLWTILATFRTRLLIIIVSTHFVLHPLCVKIKLL